MFPGFLLAVVSALFLLAFVRRWANQSPDQKFRSAKPDHALTWADYLMLVIGAVIGWQALDLMMGDARVPITAMLLGLAVILAPAALAVVLHNDRVERRLALRRPRQTRRELRESQRPIYLRLLKR